MKKLTQSSMTCAKTCLRMYYFRNICGLVKVREGEALTVGSMFHEGLEKRVCPDLPNIPSWVGSEGDYDGDLYKFKCTHALACGMIRAYISYWGDDAVKVVSAEALFEMPIKNPETGRKTPSFSAAGKIDKIVKLQDGSMALMEHKTTSDDLDPDGPYWRRLCMDQQISHYWLGAHSLGYDVKTVLYDVTRRPALKPLSIPNLDAEGLKIVLDMDGKRVMKKDNTPRQSAGDGMILQTRSETPEEYNERVYQEMVTNPERYFCRREIARLDYDIAEYREELWQQQQLMTECYRRGHWFRNTSACFKWNRPCDYFDLCTSRYTHEEGGNIPQGYEHRESHSELAAAEGGEA